MAGRLWNITVLKSLYKNRFPYRAFISVKNIFKNLILKVVIDVVEGTALEALPAMEALLRGRPEHFRTVNSAVEWAVKTSYIKNVDSARISMPDQVVRCCPDDMDDPSMKWVC